MIDYCIWGFGKEGQASYQYLSRLYPNASIAVLTDVFDAKVAQLFTDKQYFYADGGLDLLAQGHFKTIVKSPGISLYRDELVQAKLNGSLVTSSTNLWFQRFPDAKKIIVTGTKGKSTTATLLHYCLSLFGMDLCLAGNLGTPLIDVEPGKDWTILELSSYQLADLTESADISILLNLFPEHIPWHKSVEQYYLDKTHSLKLSSSIICNGQSQLVSQYLVDVTDKTTHFDTPNGFNVKDHQLYYKEDLLQHNFTLKGDHNLANLVCVLTLLDQLKLSWRSILMKLADFEALPHRMELFVDANGIEFINDSISTTPESTKCAIECLANTKLFLLLGGAERQQNYLELLSYLETLDIGHIALIGVTGKRINDYLISVNSKLNFAYYDRLKDACVSIQKLVKPGEKVLLSPAAPSFGEFDNFQQRGDAFLLHAGFSR
ncbi:UDP-N-acetylmuramoyl-L-alanine--D-glutamate ligase [Catenovulum maritimum]|uniref:UDP-N-acetylmuramoylalanine--D-glutamate ligase n=1 Tax=Catenovulum maritimum TaxID=1513271 RepID=A0A0J8GX47_9ALTE|nr:UDP-N-acetylmuramoyl-L-alanine--D-glutamate ligase [Catenovulum maritimum]KMT65834.1 hypothetical protein XM47_07510 [Catenovulum maritimum]